MDAGKRTINDIFNGNRVLEIPFFQREYVWASDQWERLLDDMEHVSQTNKPYFLGSVILKQQPTNTSNRVGDVRTIIDGQQRLTTLNIFFKVLCLKTNQNSAFERIFKLIDGSQALLHSRNDTAAFVRIVELETLEGLSGNDRITEAYRYFADNLDPSKLNFQNILAKVLLVGIDLDEHEDEQQIFDTINSLGVKLTTAELLKNYFFSRDDLTTYERYWTSVFEKDEQTKAYWDREITTGNLKRAFIDLFFFSYLQIKIQDKTLNVKSEDKIEFSKVEHLFDSFKRFIKEYLNNDKRAVLDEIKDYAQLFQANFNYDVVEAELPQESGIDRINAIIFGLETATLIPYVLYLLHEVDDENQRNSLFGFIEAYVMRRMIARASTKNYAQFFTERLIGNSVKSRDQFSEFLDKQADKANYLPEDAELKAGFHNASLTNKQSAGILYLIESTIRQRSMQSTQLLGLRKYSLEHLMPKKWENHWQSLVSEDEIAKRNKKLLTLGNLTIITQALNSTIRDADWTTKKMGRGDKKGLRTYATGLETINEYLELSEWNEEAIGARASDLYQHAQEVWKTNKT